MKKITYLLLVFNLGLLYAQQNIGLSLSKATHDFGDIKVGDQVSVDLELINNSDSPLLIDAIQTQCGCTTTEKPVEPILPQSKKTIKVTFDSTGKEGFIRKSVTIVSSQGTEFFVFTANIIQ